MSVTKLQLQNKIINGAFDFWQRGTSFAAIANNIYSADRWKYEKNGTMVHTLSRSTDVPSSSSSLYSCLIDCTTAQASIAAGNYVSFEQFIEGNVLRSFKGKKMALTFWVKATKTGTYCVGFCNDALNRSLIKEYTVNVTNTWEKKVIRFEHDSSGTWVYDNGIGVRAYFTLACGSTYHAPSANTWLNGNYQATANQVNACDNIANNFQIADICLVEDNEGQTRDSDFMYAGRDYFEELQLCMRYYEKSYDLNTAPGTVTGRQSDFNQAVTSYRRWYSWTVIKRAAPASTIYNAATGAINSLRSGATDYVASTQLNDIYGCRIFNTTGTVVANDIAFEIVADAEL